jgi:hypothetical protein
MSSVNVMNPKGQLVLRQGHALEGSVREAAHHPARLWARRGTEVGCPCYTTNKKNVVLIHGFKDYCALLFHKGALLKDEEGILVQQTENVQSARQVASGVCTRSSSCNVH